MQSARVSLEQKFNLLEKSVEKEPGCYWKSWATSTNSTPVRIESFDNSIMRFSPVYSCFVNGKPGKKDYRNYKIKTVVGPEWLCKYAKVIRRRYGPGPAWQFWHRQI